MKKTLKRVFVLALAAAMTLSLAACGGKDGEQGDDADATYTYNVAMSTFPTNWNPHTYQTTTDAEILGYITEGFYSFDYNETKDGYKIVPQMATAEPVDVTADYVGKYGIEEGDTAKAWKITLRDDLCWEDGTAITAQDFVTSAELLLNPVAGNYRADSLYSGNMTIVNAKDFLYNGQYVYETDMAADGFYEVEKDADGYYVTTEGNAVVLKLNDACIWFGGAIADYAAYFGDDYAVLEGAADANGVVKVNDEVIAVLETLCATYGGGYENEWQEFCFLGEQFAEMDFSEVGIFATADNELVLVLEKPLEGFYLLYSLTDSWLVNEELYKECETVTDGVYNNTYGTSAETTISYGPYKLASFQADKQYVLERNDNHYDVKAGYYKTTSMQVDCVAEASTRLEYFLKGELDSYGLQAEDMATYQQSEHTYFTDGESTYFVALNPDKAGLTTAQTNAGENINKTILTVLEFRQALSFALNRDEFALATMPTLTPAFGVFSNLIISDPENGTGYRSTDEAKEVLAQFWGVSEEIGDGKLYADLDEAVNSITGYNLDKAKQLFDVAYDKAIAEGLMDEDDVVEIKIGLPSTSSTYTNGYEFLSNCYTEAVKGTKLEGKLTFTKDDTIGNGFADALKSNQVDLLFYVGWSGSALDPYGLMEAYTSTDYQYDPAWDTTTTMWDITLSDGVTYTASVWDWTLCMGGEVITITAADGTTKEYSCGTADELPEDRFAILTGLEGAVLSTYDMIPLTGAASATLKGMQIQYYTENYVYGVGRGGLKYMDYNYSDAEWADYVSEQGGSLVYN